MGQSLLQIIAIGAPALLLARHAADPVSGKSRIQRALMKLSHHHRLIQPVRRLRYRLQGRDLVAVDGKYVKILRPAQQAPIRQVGITHPQVHMIGVRQTERLCRDLHIAGDHFLRKGFQIRLRRAGQRGGLIDRLPQPFKAGKGGVPRLVQAVDPAVFFPHPLLKNPAAGSLRRVGQHFLRDVQPVYKGPLRLVSHKIPDQQRIRSKGRKAFGIPLCGFPVFRREHIREIPEYGRFRMRKAFFGKRIQRDHIGQPGKADELPVRPVPDGVDSPGAQVIPDDLHPAFLPVFPEGRLQILHSVVVKIICSPSASSMAVPGLPVSCSRALIRRERLPVVLSFLLSHKGQNGRQARSFARIDAVQARGEEGVPLRIRKPVSSAFPLRMEPSGLPEFLLRPASVSVPVREGKGASPPSFLLFRRLRTGKKLL